MFEIHDPVVTIIHRPFIRWSCMSFKTYSHDNILSVHPSFKRSHNGMRYYCTFVSELALPSGLVVSFIMLLISLDSCIYSVFHK